MWLKQSRPPLLRGVGEVMGAICSRRAAPTVLSSEEPSEAAVKNWQRLVGHAVKIVQRKRVFACLGHFFNFEFRARRREAGLK